MKFKGQFGGLYRKIKLMLFRSMFKHIRDTGDALTSTEYFCLQCIALMDKPTISQFAKFFDISSPNATYKVRSLINKGFLTKEKSAKDGREYLLVPTKKFFEIYGNDADEGDFKDLTKDFNKIENRKFEKIMNILVEKN